MPPCSSEPMKASACPTVGSKMSPRGSPGLGGVEGEDVVVVEVHPVGAELGQLVHGPLGGHRRPHRAPEHVNSLPAHRPDAEREAILAGRRVTVSGHSSGPSCPSSGKVS